MNLLQFILSPFIFIIEQVFLASYQLTHNYGAAIILLSFAISLLLLPIFIFIEKAKKKDDAIKLTMKPLIDEIKRCYKGQERYYYLKTLNRQHHYSPVRALIPILSLLIQIPFFIAAYQFLENFAPLVEVGFLFIKDLSEPDALFGAINILPIAMTVVNLLTAYYYTRNGNTAERKQMLVVAGIFLILLFNLPSGLVLYWTLNNVFSFFRLFITNPEVFRKSEKQEISSNSKFVDVKAEWKLLLPKLGGTFIALSLLTIASQINWAFLNSFETIFIRLLGAIVVSTVLTFIIGAAIIKFNLKRSVISKIKIQPKIYYTLVFLTLYFWGAGEFYFTGVNTQLLYFSLAALIPLQSIGLLYTLRNIKITKPSIAHTISFLLIFIFCIQLLNVLVLFNEQKILLEIFNAKLIIENSTLSNIIFSGIIFSLITLPYYYKSYKTKFYLPIKSSGLIYFLSVVYITGLVFFWNPLLVFSSSPETFDFAAIKIIENNYLVFLQFFIAAIVLYILLPKKAKPILAFTMLVFVAIVFIYIFVVPLNLGSLQESRFSNQEKLAVNNIYYLVESFIIVSIFIAIKWLYQKTFTKAIIWVLIVLNTFLIGQSLFSAINSNHFLKTGREKTTAISNTSDLKPISFSKEKPNIVFFIADGFQGWFMNQILIDNPELKTVFDGFVWYPNTLSMANYTHASLPSMLGGYDYSVDKLNENANYTIREKWYNASEMFITKAKSKGYTFSSEYIHYTHFNDTLVDNTIPYWDDSWKTYENDINLGVFSELWYKRLYENAIFYSVPLFLKPKIYNNKKWLAHYSKKKNISNYSFKWYNFIRLLPYISNNNSDKQNFIFIHNAAAHNPWNIVTDKGNVIQDVSPYKNNEWYMNQLGKWIEWMKKNEVYNNTKIIIISDHGPTWDQFDGKLNFDSPLLVDKDNKKKIWDRHFWRLNALLMVKDFASKGPLKEDWRLMSNADASAIAFDENDPTKGDSISRTLNTYWTFWASKMITNKTMVVNKHFEVTDNMFDLKKWEKIE